MSQRSYNTENSHFSTEDIPIISSPSPFPGRVTFLGPEEVQAPSDDEEEDQEFEVGVCVCVCMDLCVCAHDVLASGGGFNL